MGRPPPLIRAMPERKRFFSIDVFPYDDKHDDDNHDNDNNDNADNHDDNNDDDNDVTDFHLAGAVP